MAFFFKVMSIVIMLPTIVVLFVGNQPALALTASLLSLLMEVGIKVVMMIRIYYILEMEKIRDGDTPEFQAKKRAYFRRLAIKWHADILVKKFVFWLVELLLR